MNRILNYALRTSQFDSMHFIDGEIMDSPSVDVKDTHSQLLDYIFGTNPVTGQATGDIAAFMSDKTNPEVRAFIETQLMRESVSSDGIKNLPTDVLNKFRSVSDDDVALFSRNHDEGLDEYVNRVRLHFANERYKAAVEKRQKVLNKELDEFRKKHLQ